MILYFDNSATTRTSEEAARAMYTAATEDYGNPSSLHRMGKQAEHIVQTARCDLLRALNRPCLSSLDAKKSLIFTSGGTEANNLAVLGTAYSKARNKTRRLIVSDSEHPSVLECAAKLRREGYDVYSLSTRGGVLHTDDIAQALEKEPFLVSCMTVNNETGAVYDTDMLFSMVKSRYPKAVTHTDAVQAFLHVPVTQKADLVSVSSHKIHGPKGVGALYIAPLVLTAKALSPVAFGGGQETGMRSGTENVPGIAGFGCAAKCGIDTSAQAAAREYILAHLPADVRANLPLGKAAPHILSLGLPGIRSETMLHYLEERDILVSSGSACSSNTHHGSYVLRAFGLSDTDADSTIRLSFDSTVTIEQAQFFLDVLEAGTRELVRSV